MDTKTGYDLWSKNYDAFENPMIAMTEHALDHLPSRYGGKRVLELGCGTGRNSTRVYREGASDYVGVDASSGMLSIARERTPAARWIEADLSSKLPFADADFDFVLITLVLEHLPSLENLFGEIARVLRVGGEFRLIEIHPGLVTSGTGAHFWHEGEEISLASFAHTRDEYVASARGLAPIRSTEWFAPPALLSKLPKLGKHSGPIILDLSFARK